MEKYKFSSKFGSENVSYNRCYISDELYMYIFIVLRYYDPDFIDTEHLTHLMY